MMIKILGTLDFFIGITILFQGIFKIIPEIFITILGLILLLKGLIFIASLNIISFLDIACGFIIISITLITIPFLVIGIVSLFLIQKGFFSLVD